MDSLPSEFAELANKITHVQMNNRNHFRSSCPECRDHGHDYRKGPPDRFQMWVKSTTYGGPLGWCSRCGYKWWPGKENGEAVDPETLRKLEAQAAAAQAEQDRRRREKLAEFSDKEIWLEYCERMESRHQEWWEKQGIPVDVQQYLSLGYIHEKRYRYAGSLYTSPAYTIPWFGDNFDFQTMQYRLTDPVRPGDKYRFEYDLEGGKTLVFRADPGDQVGDKVIICEGAKKAMVVRYRLLPVNTEYVVIGVASKGTVQPAIELVKDSGLVYVILDPDGLRQALDACDEIGKSSHPVRLPYKVDDGFLHYGLQRKQFSSILDTAL